MIEPSQWTTFANLVLQPRQAKAEAVFIHGWGDLHDELIALGADCYHQYQAKLVILNGHEQYEINGPGVSAWRTALVDRHGIPANAITAIPPADQTGAEAIALMALVKNENLKSVVIVSHPVHIVRAMLTQIGAMRQSGLDLKLYPQTITTVDWNEVVEIRSLAAAAPETTRRLARLFGESARMMKYNEIRQGGDASYPMASIEEGIAYFKQLA